MGCGSIFNINSIEDIDQVKEILEGKNIILYPNHNIYISRYYSFKIFI